jgi:hypothetical protein
LVPAKIGARNRRISSQRAALIGAQRLALPFRRLALGGLQSRARHRDLDRPERPGQRPRPAAVAVARRGCSAFIGSLLASLITRPRQRIVELAADQLFDELARPDANLGLDRIKPVVEKINNHLGCRLRRIRLRGSARHGVVSGPALQRRMIRG